VGEWKPRTVFSFTQAKSGELAKKRTAQSGNSLQGAVAESLKLPAPTTVVPDYRILRPSARNYPKPHSTAYVVETEPGISAVVTRLSDKGHVSRPPQGNPRAVLYVAHHSSDEELRDEPLVRELLAAETESEFYAVDVRGIGESRPDTCGSAELFTKPYGSDFFYAAHSIMLDRPYVGQKTWDVLRVLTWLTSHGHRQIHLAGLGWGTLPATFAAVLSSHVSQVTLKGSLPSYASIAENEDYTWPLSALVPNVLAKFDLPDCYAELEKNKKLRLV
jgi:pimeloyl-ACP methyl ester carboxylesterase